ncbi:S8 family serine peptidase [Candidatus Falkowbacteria bacterium]|nr:S8 family serine peptidase [Candidatus Falkowbacteria bacterium]
MSKKIRGFFAYFLILALLSGGFLPLNFSWAKEQDLSGILVKFKSGELKQFNVLGQELETELADYRSRADVVYAEKDHIYRTAIIPSDVYYNEQWYLKKIKADKAWDEIRETPDITIAVIDSGVQITHPDLSANIWINEDEIADNGIDDDKNGFIDDRNGWDFVENIPDPSPKFKEGFTEQGVTHGTIVAGVAAAVGNNGVGITGVTWNARIMPLRALDDFGEGLTSNVVRAIDYAIANKADIINFSFVGFSYSQSLFEAVARAHRAGIIMVAAAGNEQMDGSGYNLDQVPMYPACHDGENGENMVIGVAATDTLDQKTEFSSYGFSCVDIVAPGMSIYSSVPYEPNKKLGDSFFNKYYDGYWSGTSMATPIVAGGVALIEGANKELNAKDVKEVLLDSTDNISRLNPDYLGQLGRGRINLQKAVSEAKEKLGSHDSNIIVSPASEKLSLVKIVDPEGGEMSSFKVYGDNFFGGADVAAGDIDGDGQDEIIAGAGNGGGPHIRIFDANGRVLSQFFAYNENFRGGVHVAAGDIDGDGQDEIVSGAGFGGGPQVRIFDNNGELKSQFFAYDENFRGGVDVSVADIDGGAARKSDEIITSPGKTGGPHIRVFDKNGDVKDQFFAYQDNFRGGVNIAAGDVDDDGLAEIITGAGKTGGPHIRIFEKNGSLSGSFYAYEKDFLGGVNVGIIKIKK